ncbi:hypothetical protein TNCT1_41740 [Streptomyces sp. 1-11]|nr:hypothetical protein TNCT1_41740 [Streptomyces sp. 1-11]
MPAASGSAPIRRRLPGRNTRLTRPTRKTRKTRNRANAAHDEVRYEMEQPTVRRTEAASRRAEVAA